jgi:hypothetical protein
LADIELPYRPLLHDLIVSSTRDPQWHDDMLPAIAHLIAAAFPGDYGRGEGISRIRR